jgi:hypothetical protein
MPSPPTQAKRTAALARLRAHLADPDSPKRTHPCHLEWLAPFLASAGWSVVLYGEPQSLPELP